MLRLRCGEDDKNLESLNKHSWRDYYCLGSAWFNQILDVPPPHPPLHPSAFCHPGPRRSSRNWEFCCRSRKMPSTSSSRTRRRLRRSRRSCRSECSRHKRLVWSEEGGRAGGGRPGSKLAEPLQAPSEAPGVGKGRSQERDASVLWHELNYARSIRFLASVAL